MIAQKRERWGVFSKILVGSVTRTCLYCVAPIHFPARPRLLPLPVRLHMLSQPVPFLAHPPVTVSVLDRRIPQIVVTLLNEGSVLEPLQQRMFYLSFGSSLDSPMPTISSFSV